MVYSMRRLLESVAQLQAVAVRGLNSYRSMDPWSLSSALIPHVAPTPGIAGPMFTERASFATFLTPCTGAKPDGDRFWTLRGVRSGRLHVDSPHRHPP